jgi:inosose dehydratase
VTVTLENEFDCFGADAVHSDLTRRPAALRKLVSVIGSDRFALTFDACNAWFTGLDPAVFLAEVGEHVAQVHVKDGREVDGPIGPWRRFADRGVAYATCPLGVGGLDWPRLLDLVWDTGYRGWLTIEPHSAPEHRAQAWTQAAGHLRALLGARHDENGHDTW